MRDLRSEGTDLKMRYCRTVSSWPRMSSCFESIDAKAENNDEMRKALTRRPTNMDVHVTITSAPVSGSTSLGTSDVIIAAPQKKECIYLSPKSPLSRRDSLGTQLFSATLRFSRNHSSSSMSETSHQRQPT
eukprot:5928292-Prymnesium_polylepis.1